MAMPSEAVTTPRSRAEESLTLRYPSVHSEPGGVDREAYYWEL